MSTAVPQSAERIANINPSAVPVVDREKWCLGLATALYLKKNNLLSGGWDTLHELERRVVEHEAHKLRLVADLVDSADSAKKLSQGLTPEELRGVATLGALGFLEDLHPRRSLRPFRIHRGAERSRGQRLIFFQTVKAPRPGAGKE
jgi:hypothetical protein